MYFELQFRLLRKHTIENTQSKLGLSKIFEIGDNSTCAKSTYAKLTVFWYDLSFQVTMRSCLFKTPPPPPTHTMFCKCVTLLSKPPLALKVNAGGDFMIVVTLWLLTVLWSKQQQQKKSKSPVNAHKNSIGCIKIKGENHVLILLLELYLIVICRSRCDVLSVLVSTVS